MAKNKNTLLTFSCFLLGAATGSLTTFLFSTHGGKVFRRILINDTDLMWENIESKSRDIFYFVDASIRHIYKKALRSIDTEIRGVKAGINAAITLIKEDNSSYGFIEDITEDFIINEEDFGFSSDSLPKQEGMRRRRDHKRFS
jgi:gas vesicle protein